VDVPARWAELMRGPETGLPLDEAALLISASANPVLDVGAQLGRLDELAGRIDRTGVEAVCRFLFKEFGLRGDREHYDDPLNSYLDRVLDRGRGIPISLSVLLIEIGRRCGVRLEAVGMPGHFLVRDPATPEQLIDAFDRGRRLSYDDCERLLQTTSGNPARLTSDMLAATGHRAVLARMLANLDASFARRNDRGSMGWVSTLRMSIPGTSPADRLQLARRLAALGRFHHAADLLEALAVTVTGADQRDRLRHHVTVLRARLN
jgi:regulator of sirC expression with transglutaminase-like and TPR domain